MLVCAIKIAIKTTNYLFLNKRKNEKLMTFNIDVD